MRRLKMLILCFESVLCKYQMAEYFFIMLRPFYIFYDCRQSREILFRGNFLFHQYLFVVQIC